MDRDALCKLFLLRRQPAAEEGVKTVIKTRIQEVSIAKHSLGDLPNLLNAKDRPFQPVSFLSNIGLSTDQAVWDVRRVRYCFSAFHPTIMRFFSS